MDELEKMRSQFFSALEELKAVDTREHLDEVRVRLKEAKEYLSEHDPEYVDMVNKNKRRYRDNMTKLDVEDPAIQVKTYLNNLNDLKNTVDSKTLDMRTSQQTVICCPTCFSTNSTNTTKPLNRKARRYPENKNIHPSAFCIKCNKRMAYMKTDERKQKIMEKNFKEQNK